MPKRPTNETRLRIGRFFLWQLVFIFPFGGRRGGGDERGKKSQGEQGEGLAFRQIASHWLEVFWSFPLSFSCLVFFSGLAFLLVFFFFFQSGHIGPATVLLAQSRPIGLLFLLFFPFHFLVVFFSLLQGSHSFWVRTLGTKARSREGK